MAGDRNALQEASLLLQRGAVDRARAILASIVQREPGNADALALLGIAHAAQQDYASAREILERAVRANPQHAAAHANLGNVLKKLGLLEDAALSLRLAIALRPDKPATYFALGALLLELRRSNEAVDLYSRLMARNSPDAETSNGRGVAHLCAASYGDAIADFDAAIALAPAFVPAWSNQALALLRMGKIEDALAAIERALALDEGNAATLALRGEILRRAGLLHEAIASFERAIALNGDAWEAFCGLGVCRTVAGDFAAATAALNRAAQLRPDEAQPYLERARLARAMGNTQAALFDLDNVLRLNPSHADALMLRSGVRREIGECQNALADCDRAIEGDPANWRAHNNRGVLLDELDRVDEAFDAFEESFRLNPNNAEAYQNLGALMASQGRGDEALAKFADVLKADPHADGAYNGMGTVLTALRRFDEALAAFDIAVALRPEAAISNFHRAIPLLVRGRLLKGFEAYEWRLRGEPPLVDLSRLPEPELQTGEDPAGRRLLMPGEQGLGDVIQFCRFARTFAERGAEVFLAVNPALQRLLASLGENIAVVRPEAPPPIFDRVCPILSAPHKLGVTLETIPTGPYLTAPAELREVWRGRLVGHRAPRIGIAWSGNPQFVNDRARSMSFDQFKSIIEGSQATFVALQKDVRMSDQASFADSSVLDVRHELGDLMDTAALISELDLVISVDTVVAHVAGALGKPVWLLLSAMSDWRWLEARSDSPWYPSARLFRQSKLGAWDSVLAEVRAELIRFDADTQGR